MERLELNFQGQKEGTPHLHLRDLQFAVPSVMNAFPWTPEWLPLLSDDAISLENQSFPTSIFREPPAMPWYGSLPGSLHSLHQY